MSMHRPGLLTLSVLLASSLFTPGCASTTSGDRAAAYEPHEVRKGEVVYIREVEMPVEVEAASSGRTTHSGRAAVNQSRAGVMGIQVGARRSSSLRVGSSAGSGGSEPAQAPAAQPGVELTVELENGSVVVVVQPLGDDTFDIGDFVQVLLRNDGGAVVLQ